MDTRAMKPRPIAKRKAGVVSDQKVRAANKKGIAKYGGVFQALDDAKDIPVRKIRAEWFREMTKLSPKERLGVADKLVQLSKARQHRNP